MDILEVVMLAMRERLGLNDIISVLQQKRLRCVKLQVSDVVSYQLCYLLIL